jgi:hypothetical protein
MLSYSVLWGLEGSKFNSVGYASQGAGSFEWMDRKPGPTWDSCSLVCSSLLDVVSLEGVECLTLLGP